MYQMQMIESIYMQQKHKIYIPFSVIFFYRENLVTPIIQVSKKKSL